METETAALSTKIKTAREEAATADRSKRDAEMDELRRLRAEKMAKAKSVKLSAADVARQKREEEMEELRRLKAGDNEENRKRLAAKGGALTTDMDAWRTNQWGAKEADRKSRMEAEKGLHGHRQQFDANALSALEAKEAARRKKLEAEAGLHGHRGYYDAKTAAALDKDAMTQAQRDQMAAMANLKVGEDGAPIPDEEHDGRPRGVMFKDADEEIPMHKKNGNLKVSFNAGSSAAAMAVAEEVIPEKKMPPEAVIPEATPVEASESPTYALKTPTFSRVDIKFSFGLIVRSSAADGFKDENLRNNETLRKCMDGTHKILMDQMPSPPDMAKMEGKSSFTSFKIKWPEAYYNPSLEPTVISIEEDKKNEEGKKTTKGNKRTLVKASFPVFLRDEAVDDEGTKRSARMLKETKTTVFKALRAAVSGGSFLR